LWAWVVLAELALARWFQRGMASSMGIGLNMVFLFTGFYLVNKSSHLRVLCSRLPAGFPAGGRQAGILQRNTNFIVSR